MIDESHEARPLRGVDQYETGKVADEVISTALFQHPHRERVFQSSAPRTSAVARRAEPVPTRQGEGRADDAEKDSPRGLLLLVGWLAHSHVENLEGLKGVDVAGFAKDSFNAGIPFLSDTILPRRRVAAIAFVHPRYPPDGVGQVVENRKAHCPAIDQLIVEALTRPPIAC